MLSLWSPFCTEIKKFAHTSNCLVAVRARSQQIFFTNDLDASARLALEGVLLRNCAVVIVSAGKLIRG